MAFETILEEKSRIKMPTLISVGNDCSTYIVDGECAYEIKNRDVMFFIDFEFVYALLPDDIKEKISIEKQHCDAIRISMSEQIIIIDLFELSMNEKREPIEYLKKHYYCLKFVDYLLGKIKRENVKVRVNDKEVEIKGLKVNAFVIANPTIAKELSEKIGKLEFSHYFRDLASKYPIKKPIVVECQTLTRS